jgi:hypothetical protein
MIHTCEETKLLSAETCHRAHTNLNKEQLNH